MRCMQYWMIGLVRRRAGEGRARNTEALRWWALGNSCLLCVYDWRLEGALPSTSPQPCLLTDNELLSQDTAPGPSQPFLSARPLSFVRAGLEAYLCCLQQHMPRLFRQHYFLLRQKYFHAAVAATT